MNTSEGAKIVGPPKKTSLDPLLKKTKGTYKGLNSFPNEEMFKTSTPNLSHKGS